MMRNLRCSLLACLILPIAMGTGGCTGGSFPAPDFAKLAGLYDITRGAVKVTLGGAATDGSDVQSGGGSSTLEPIDLATVADPLKPVAQAWNDNLAALNDSLDKSFPDQVIVEFPSPYVMRITNAADASNTGDGLINADAKYLFAGDLSGSGQGSDEGGGALLQVATIDGSFNTQDKTTEGKVARTLILTVWNGQAFVAITFQISVDYTGQRTGDVPTTQPAP